MIEFPSRFRNSNVRERDQAYIKSDKKNLINNSLNWLAQTISISRDSHRRLLLLAREALNLDAEQQLSKQFREIPWIQIFRLLGDKYAQDARSRKLTEEDEEDLMTLLRCLRNPRIGPFIAPGNQEEYTDLTSPDALHDEPDTEGPNSVHLLLRNIQLPEMALSIEEQVKLRTGCLNQAHFVPQYGQTPGSFHGDLIPKGTSDICDYLIPHLAKELISSPHDDEQDRVDNLICLAHLRQPPLDNFPLVLDGWFSIPNPSILIYRLRCAYWVHSQVDHPHIHTILKALHTAQGRNPDVSLLWRFEATEEEISTALTTLSAIDRSLVPFCIQDRREEPGYIATLQAFDKLIARGCTSDQRCIMIDLMCNDLKKVSLYPKYFNNHRQSIMALKDPGLRLCGFLAAGMYQELDESSIVYKDLTGSLEMFLKQHLSVDLPWTRPLPRLQMRFWRRMLTNTNDRIVEPALGDLNILKYLATTFTQPDLGIDHGEDFLLQILHFSLNSRARLISLPGYNGHGYILPLLVYGRTVPFEAEDGKNAKNLKREYIGYLLELCEDIKRSPSRLLRLLVQLAKRSNPSVSFSLEARFVLDVHYMIKVIRSHCLGRDKLPYVVDMHELAHLLTGIRDEIIEGWERLLSVDGNLMAVVGAKNGFKTRCTNVIRRLLSPRPTAFGL
ncbi:hypothetical protein CPB86DRAFT_736413, partial [Serendipita vermifera]